MMGRYDWGHMGGWGWVGVSLGSVLLLALVGFVAWLVVRAADRPGAGSPPPARTAAQGTAERVLADRFARGEIDEDEYRRRLGALRSVGAGPDAW